jgi:hypothetical protein
MDVPMEAKITQALKSCKEKTGLSRTVIKNYIIANFYDNDMSVNNKVTGEFNSALKKGIESGIFIAEKGVAGKVTLAGTPVAPTTK